MQRIYKYEMPDSNDFYLELPIGAQFLSLQLQNGKPMMWFLIIDPAEAQSFYTHFCVVGTGQQVPSWHGVRLQYLDTIQIDGFVWHLFQKHVVETEKSDHTIDAMRYLMQVYK